MPTVPISPASEPTTRTGAALLLPGGGEAPPTRGLWHEAFLRVLASGSGRFGLLLILFFVGVAVLAPWIAPFNPADNQWLSDVRPGVYPGPSAEHWLGIDTQGRDVLSRLIWGARHSLLIGVVSLILGASVGLLLGFFAGAMGGWVDGVIMRLMDIMLAVPSLLFAIAVAAVLGQSLTSVMIAVAVTSVPIFARLLRGQMLSQRDADYVVAARSIGVKGHMIALRHILPNSVTPVIVQGTLFLATAIIDAAGLAFLGLSTADPSTPEWGRMLTDAQNALATAPLLALLPGTAIVLSALGFTLLGEQLREALDPKYRR